MGQKTAPKVLGRLALASLASEASEARKYTLLVFIVWKRQGQKIGKKVQQLDLGGLAVEPAHISR